MIFADRAPIEKVRRLADGRIAAVAKFARSGIQTYTGAEVGRPDLAAVRVYRDEAEVFSEDAMASFAHKAITLDHPSEPVSSKNWRKVSVGYTEGRVARDGAFVEIPLILADAEAVSTFDRGTARELSAGYSCSLDWTPGKTPQGEAYDARQVGIRGNHIALVGAGRAGSECRIGDSAPASTTDARAASIDETVKAAIEQRAKLANQKPAEWLASAMPREIERLIESAAKAHVSALGGEGIARGFALDSIIRRVVDVQHGAHDGKFAFMGDAAPAFDRERAEFLARAKYGGQASGNSAALSDASVTRTLAAARYSGTAPLVDAEAQPKASTGPAMHDAGGQAKPAAINALRAARYSAE